MQPHRNPSLRLFLVMIALAAACSAQSLRQEADRIGIQVGAAANIAYLREPAYTSTLAREFNLLEPEDAMKWTALRPDERTFDFGDGDRLVAFAEVHNMSVRGHNLVWGMHNPQWLADGHYTAEQLHNLLQEHIRRVVEHYRGKVFAWDVVNEALDDNGELRDSIWYNRPGIGLAGQGTAYIEQVFRWAHAADPKALLFYNEAGAEFRNRKSDAVYAMVRDFKQRGVPIDGVGMQMHLLDLKVDAPSLAANLARLTKLGVQVHITEMDVAVPVDGDGNVLHEADLARQTDIYRQVAMACVQNPGCTGFQTWGFTDKYSWIGWFTHKTKGDALLFDKRYKPKPAYEAVRQVFLSLPVR
jgi:endo-1,4-beta-xylanase